MSKIDEDWQGQRPQSGLLRSMPRGKAEDKIYLKELCELENLVYTQMVYTNRK
jgi:hypothetical protein